MLRRRDAGESDRRLTLLTREAGVIDVIAKGARKAASRLSGSSEPLSAAILHLAAGKKNQFVTQAQPLSSFPGLRADYERLSFGLALCELAAAVLPHEKEASEEFDFMVAALHHLEAHEKPLVALIWAEVHLLQISGFLPQFTVCVVSGIKIAEAEPFVSAHAGGYVSYEHAAQYTDRLKTRAEVLYGLAAMAEREEPPANLKFAEESLLALIPFWREVAGKDLPANEAVIGEIRHLLMAE